MPTVLSSSFPGTVSAGVAPPDSQGAVGPSSYVETDNQTVTIYDKMTGNNSSMDISDFFGKPNSGLDPVSTTLPGVQFADAVVTYDNLAGRFIIGTQNVSASDNGGDGEGVFDIAVSTKSNPTTKNTDWKFYQIVTTENDPNYNSKDPSSHPYFSSDYPGSLGYNADALVFTMNEISLNGHDNEALVVAVNMSDLTNGVPQANLHPNKVFDSNSNVTNIRPTAMHDSKAGDPMWLVTENFNVNNQNQYDQIDVYEMTNPLSTQSLGTKHTLDVDPYGYYDANAMQTSGAVPLVQPGGTKISAGHLDSRILQAAEADNVLVAAQTIAVSSTEDEARWYEINVSDIKNPVLDDQGDVPGGDSDSNNNTYTAYPGIDVNSQGDIGMSFLETGTAPGQFMSMWITGRTPADPKGTMETPVLVQAGSNKYSDSDGNRAGDLSGINVDADGSFWAVNEYATNDASNNWGTAISHFTVGQAADLSVVVYGPPTFTAGDTATYTVTVTNNGTSDAQNVTLTDTLPAGVTLEDEQIPSNPDNFSNTGTATFTADTVKAGDTDVFQLTVLVPSNSSLTSLANTATVSSSNAVPDPNLFNNTAMTTGDVIRSADLTILTATAPITVTAGTDVTYTVTIQNNGPSDAPDVSVSDILPTGLIFQSTPAAQSSGPDSFTLQGNKLFATTVVAGNIDVLQFFAHAASSLANGAPLLDTVNVSSGITDPTLPNTAQVSSTVATSADLAVKVSSPPPAVEGDTLTYTVSVTNNGPSDAQNVVLSDVLSPDVTLLSANFGAATVSSSGNTITVSLGTLTAGNTVTGTIIVQAIEDGKLTNSATVSTTTSDPNLANNTAQVTTAVAEDAINLTGGVSFTTTEFAALNNVTLATFTHAQAVEPPGAFTALVSWGDGSTSTASVVLAGTTYSVVASHTYNAEGNYSILVTVSEDGVSANATDSATVQEGPLPQGIPQSIAGSSAFEAIEDNLGQPISVGQVLTIELNLPSLLLQTAGTLLQQGEDPSQALPAVMAATIVERIDDIFHQALSTSHVMSLEDGLFNLFAQTYQAMIQQGQDPGQALLSAFYLDLVECDLFATVQMDNGVDIDTAVNQMLPSLLLQTVDMIDGSTDL